MPFRDIVGHRHLLDLVAGAATRASLPPSLIFAGPDGVGKRAAAVALAQLVNCPTPVSAAESARRFVKLDQRRLRHLRLVHAHRAPRARGRAPRRARRHRRHQGRSGARGRRAHGVSAVRGPPPRRHHRRGGRDALRGAERAAQDARGAAVGLDVRARHVAARRAAADGSVALSAAAVRAAGGGRHRGGADAVARLLVSRRARGRLGRRWQHRAGARGRVGRARRGPRGGEPRCCSTSRDTAILAGGSTAPRCSRAAAIATSCGAVCGRWPRWCATSA